MKLVRYLLISLGVVAGLAVLAAGLAFNSSFQTWAVRRALAGQPGVEVSLGRVSAGWQQVRLEQVQARFPGGSLRLPAAQISLPLLDAALRDRVQIGRLEAKGWTLDLTTAGSPPDRPAPVTVQAAATTAVMVFQGIFQQLQLPVDLSLDGVDLEGEILFTDAASGGLGRARLTVRGGRLAAGHEGAFTFAGAIGLNGGDQPVSALNVRGQASATMDSARTFARLALQLDAEASGPALPQGVQLTLDARAARVPGGETYGLNIQSVGKRLVDLQANFPDNSARLGGVWKVDVRDTDVAPFMLGRPLPAFEAVGAGMFETDAGFSYIHAAGRLKTSADRLAALRPELAVIGAFGTHGEFDVTVREGTVRIERLQWTAVQAAPVLALEALQPFEYNPATGDLKVADAAADLLVLDLQGLPLAWAAPFLPGYELSGGVLRGQLVLGAGGGGLAVRTRAPLVVDQASLAQSGTPLLRNLGLSLRLAADYSPQGWQADVTELLLAGDGQALASISAKLGQLAGPDAPLKLTGRVDAALPAWSRQPVAAAAFALARGHLGLDFTGLIGPQSDYGVRFAAEDLAAGSGEILPAIRGELRAAVGAGGDIRFELPLFFVNQARNRQSDLAATGTLRPAGDGWSVDARLGANEVFLEDVQGLAALTGPAAPADGAAAAGRPFWHGFDGQVVLALKRLHYGAHFVVTEVGGAIRLEAGALRLDGIRAGMDGGGAARINGGLTFEPAVPRPYALNADVAVTDFNPAGLFRALQPGQPPTVEGKFDITSRLTGRAAEIADLAGAAQGDFTLTSRGGVFRGLPVSVASRVESTGRIASGVAAVGGLLGAVTGRREYADIGSRAQAVADLAKALAAIPYDQLNLVLARDEALATTLKDFSLIAPEVLLTGVGEARPPAQGPWLQSALAMEFQLRARGHTAELLRYLGALEDGADELGYTRSTLPLKVAGTVAAPDTGELNRMLAGLALERSGAADLLNRLLGGGK